MVSLLVFTLCWLVTPSFTAYGVAEIPWHQPVPGPSQADPHPPDAAIRMRSGRLEGGRHVGIPPFPVQPVSPGRHWPPPPAQHQRVAEPAKHQGPAYQLLAGTRLLAPGSTASLQAMVADAAGNVYVAGCFHGRVGFGRAVLISRDSGNCQDIFVAKWRARTRSFVWAQRAGGNGNDWATALALRKGRLYVAGSFASKTARFGTLSLTDTTKDGSANMFVAALDISGASAPFAWVLKVGGERGARDAGATGLACDGRHIYVVGTFYAATFGHVRLDSFHHGTEVFVSKVLDTGGQGAFAWTLQYGTDDDDEAAAIAVRGKNIYLTGRMGSGCLHFLCQPTFMEATSCTRYSGPFIAKLTDVGSHCRLAWVFKGDEGPPASRHNLATCLAVRGANIYVAGYFLNDSLRLGSLLLVNSGASKSRTYDGFMAKLRDTGPRVQVEWAHRLGGGRNEGISALVVRHQQLYLAGVFSSVSASLGPLLLPAPMDTLSSQGFVAALTDRGGRATYSWVQKTGPCAMPPGQVLFLAGRRLLVGESTSAGGVIGAFALPYPSPSTVRSPARVPLHALPAGQSGLGLHRNLVR